MPVLGPGWMSRILIPFGPDQRTGALVGSATSMMCRSAWSSSTCCAAYTRRLPSTSNPIAPNWLPSSENTSRRGVLPTLVEIQIDWPSLRSTAKAKASPEGWYAMLRYVERRERRDVRWSATRRHAPSPGSSRRSVRRPSTCRSAGSTRWSQTTRRSLRRSARPRRLSPPGHRGALGRQEDPSGTDRCRRRRTDR